MDELTRRNIEAVLQHSNETRKQLRAFEREFRGYRGLILRIEELERQNKLLIQKLYTGGSTSG